MSFKNSAVKFKATQPSNIAAENFDKFISRSSSTELNSVAIASFYQLQKKILEYDQTTLPILEFPQAQPKRNLKKKVKKIKEIKEKKFIPSVFLPLRENEDNHVYRLSQTAVFNANRYSLGPGRYELNQFHNIPGGLLSTTPRFCTSVIENAENYLGKKYKRENLKQDIKKIDVAQSYKEKKLKGIRQFSKLKEFEEIIHKNTKIFLNNVLKEKKLERYQNKISKFEWRLRKTEIFKVQNAWSVLLVTIAMSKIVSFSILHKKYLRLKITKILSSIYWVSKGIGKFIISLRKIRLQKLIKTLSYNKIYIQTWLSKIKKNYVQAIKHVILDEFYKPLAMYQILSKFKQSIIFIQKSIKSILQITRSRRLALNILVKKFETKFYSNKNNKGFSRDNVYSPTLLEAEIRNHLIKKLKLYAKSLDEYKKNVKKYKKNILNLESKSIIEIKEDSKINKPILLIYSKQDEILKMVRSILGLDLKTKNALAVKSSAKNHPKKYFK